MEYLIRILSKSDYVRQFLAGQLNLYSAAHYLTNYEFGRGDPTECLVSKNEYLNIHTPIMCTIYATDDNGTIKLDKRILRDFCPDGGYAVALEKNCLIEHLKPLLGKNEQKQHGLVKYDLDLDKLPEHRIDSENAANEGIFHKNPRLSYQNEYRFVFPNADKAYYPFEPYEEETPWKTSVSPFDETLYVQKIPPLFEIEWENENYVFPLNDKNAVNHGDWFEQDRIRTVDDACLFAHPNSIPFYSKEKAANKTGLLGLPSFTLEIDWDVPRLLKSNCSSGYLIQLSESFCDCNEYSADRMHIDRGIQFWQIRKSIIQGSRKSKYWDEQHVDYCKCPKEAAKLFGTRGEFIVWKYISWISSNDSEQSTLIKDVTSLVGAIGSEAKAVSWGKLEKLKMQLSSRLILQRKLTIPYDCTYLDDLSLLPMSQLIRDEQDADLFLIGLANNHHITANFIDDLKAWLVETILQSEESEIVSRLDNLRKKITLTQQMRNKEV